MPSVLDSVLLHLLDAHLQNFQYSASSDDDQKEAQVSWGVINAGKEADVGKNRAMNLHLCR